VFGRLHVLPVAIEFLEAYSNIDIRVALADNVVNLQEHDVDLAVRIGELPDSSLVATRVGSIRQVVCGSPVYFTERGTPKSLRDLTNHHCITFDGLASPASWKFVEGKSTVPVAIHSRLIVNTAEAAIDAAIAGRGYARSLVPDCKRGASRRTCHRTSEVRTGAVAGQSSLCGPETVAAEAARLSRFRGAAAEVETLSEYGIELQRLFAASTCLLVARRVTYCVATICLQPGDKRKCATCA
jgi:DNA-binding transcriptional LysR family regulator